ncbi:hypothetical protein NHX12_005065 [Muraenolepis orangiensis]|uniref:Uncharacterized protein n=1 Tax=Muraenolepis orangiensis TaxID=630683 RepID=A0A9Q0DWC5_9TELE|nr:hypothetical protein NHX12_005065 [Muraenolepis orangiensis]
MSSSSSSSDRDGVDPWCLSGGPGLPSLHRGAGGRYLRPLVDHCAGGPPWLTDAGGWYWCDVGQQPTAVQVPGSWFLVTP